MRDDGAGATILISVTWCSSPTTWAWPWEMETLPLPPSLCRCPVLLLESPGPWGPDLPRPLHPTAQVLGFSLFRILHLPTIYSQQTDLPSFTYVMGCDYPFPSQASAPSLRPSLLCASFPQPCRPGRTAWDPLNSMSGGNSAELLPPVLAYHIAQLQRAQFTELGIQCE